MMSEPIFDFKKGGAQGDDYIYNTLNKRRGMALIFSIREFNCKGFEKRGCTDHDLVTIKPKLKQFGFDVKEHRYGEDKTEMKLSKAFILEKLEEAAKEDHADADCFLCLFMSYGHHGVVWASDEMFPVEELQKPFKGDKCLSLAGKPKIFLFQTCYQKPVRIAGDAIGEPAAVRTYTIPAEADFLFFWSHMNITNDQTARCSLFIEQFSSALGEMTKALENGNQQPQDFLHLCIGVTGAIEKHLKEKHPGELEKNPKLLPLVIHMLTKDLYLLPPQD